MSGGETGRLTLWLRMDIRGLGRIACRGGTPKFGRGHGQCIGALFKRGWGTDVNEWIWTMTLCEVLIGGS